MRDRQGQTACPIRLGGDVFAFAYLVLRWANFSQEFASDAGWNPSHLSTGSRGYFGKRLSVSDSRQR